MHPNKLKHTIYPVLLLNIVVSEKERKIGATLQDFSMSFWSYNDNFIEEYTFFTNAMQLKILYIESIQGWITINANNEIMKWNVEDGNGELVPLRFRGKISDIIEIKHLSLIAISSFDKVIFNWNLYLFLLSIGPSGRIYIYVMFSRINIMNIFFQYR